jgi:DNA invertase Pin-like site-specific DNA recombinase
VPAAAIRAGIYARISSDREGEGLGVARQLEDCQRLAEARGWTVVERYVDQDVSAYSGKLRPEYRRLWADIEGRAIDAVAIYRADRLHRQPRELEAFIDLCQAVGLTNVASVSGDLDLTTNEGQLVARIAGAVAKNESDVKSQRIRRQKQQAAEQGKIAGGGSRAYGWEADKKTIRVAEAEIVRECARRFLAGESTRSICADLNERGVPTATGKKWAPQTMSRMLGSPRICGEREHNGKIVADAVWPALISRDDGERIRAKLADPSRRTNKSARRYLLVRLLKCWHCGEYLVAAPRGDGTRRYGCRKGPGASGCGKTFINAEPLEQFVTLACLARLNSRELAEAVRAQADQPEAERWQREADTAEAKLAELAAAWSADEITRDEWRVARTALEHRLTTARKQLSKITRTTVLDGLIGNADLVQESWASLDLSRQHAILQAILDHVEIGPARRGYNAPLDESRLRPVFRL